MKKHEKGGEKLPKGSKRTSRPGRDHREGPVQASQRRLRGFQKRKNLPKTMIFLRIWWKMKKNYDFLGSGPLRSSQKPPEGLQTSQQTRRLRCPGQPRRPRLLRTAQNDEKPMKMMIFWPPKCDVPMALLKKRWKSMIFSSNPRIPDLQISKNHQNHWFW